MRTANILVAVIEIVLLVVTFFLGFRFILRLFGARSDAPFVQWIYETSEPILAPFVGIFPAAVADGRFVLEFSTLFAIIVYGLLGYLLIELVNYIDDVSHTDRKIVER